MITTRSAIARNAPAAANIRHLGLSGHAIDRAVNVEALVANRAAG